jgi:hypothetical protein
LGRPSLGASFPAGLTVSRREQQKPVPNVPRSIVNRSDAPSAASPRGSVVVRHSRRAALCALCALCARCGVEARCRNVRCCCWRISPCARAAAERSYDDRLSDLARATTSSPACQHSRRNGDVRVKCILDWQRALSLHACTHTQHFDGLSDWREFLYKRRAR